jgi:hypothetical protein
MTLAAGHHRALRPALQEARIKGDQQAKNDDQDRPSAQPTLRWPFRLAAACNLDRARGPPAGGPTGEPLAASGAA